MCSAWPRGRVALRKMFGAAVKLFVQGIDRVHAVVHAAVHVACDLLEFQTQEYLFCPLVPGVDDGTLIIGEVEPSGVLKFEHACA